MVSVHGRNVQQPWNAEPNAADLREPSADAEHAVCSLHAQYDAVTGSEPRIGLPGMRPEDTHTYLHVFITGELEDSHTIKGKTWFP